MIVLQIPKSVDKTVEFKETILGVQVKTCGWEKPQAFLHSCEVNAGLAIGFLVIFIAFYTVAMSKLLKKNHKRSYFLIEIFSGTNF